MWLAWWLEETTDHSWRGSRITHRLHNSAKESQVEAMVVLYNLPLEVRLPAPSGWHSDTPPPHTHTLVLTLGDEGYQVACCSVAVLRQQERRLSQGPLGCGENALTLGIWPGWWPESDRGQRGFPVLEVGLSPTPAPLFSLSVYVTNIQCYLLSPFLSVCYHLSPRGYSCLRKGSESLQEVGSP